MLFIFMQGELIGVIGKVGSGKTSLLLSLLSEMRRIDGGDGGTGAVRLGSRRGIGLVTQQAWIQQGTIKDNVLMGEQFHYDRYQRAIEASALHDDLKVK